MNAAGLRLVICCPLYPNPLFPYRPTMRARGDEFKMNRGGWQPSEQVTAMRSAPPLLATCSLIFVAIGPHQDFLRPLRTSDVQLLKLLFGGSNDILVEACKQ